MVWEKKEVLQREMYIEVIGIAATSVSKLSKNMKIITKRYMGEKIEKGSD